ncbi:MAG TPA: response regulator transcription factor [Gaiellaceae bacterium]|nr:response regulator transcription factor [Gaiellaceae bacterium]
MQEEIVDLRSRGVLVDDEYLSPGVPDRVRVLIADDQRLFAEALEAILSTDGRISVVGRASDGEAAVGLARDEQPDVVLMDISMPVLDGISATQAIRAELPETRVIVLTGSNAPSDVSRARAAGAAGYVTKDQIAGDLLRAILDAAGR